MYTCYTGNFVSRRYFVISTRQLKSDGHLLYVICNPYISGFGGLVVSMPASGTRVRGFKPSRSRQIFRVKKSTACLPSRLPSEAVCPMWQICGTLKNPYDYMEVGSKAKFVGQFLARAFLLRYQRALRSCSMGAPGVDGGNYKQRCTKGQCDTGLGAYWATRPLHQPTKLYSDVLLSCCGLNLPFALTVRST
jgi:hypothetical protein